MLTKTAAMQELFAVPPWWHVSLAPALPLFSLCHADSSVCQAPGKLMHDHLTYRSAANQRLDLLNSEPELTEWLQSRGFAVKQLKVRACWQDECTHVCMHATSLRCISSTCSHPPSPFSLAYRLCHSSRQRDKAGVWLPPGAAGRGSDCLPSQRILCFSRVLQQLVCLEHHH